MEKKSKKIPLKGAIFPVIFFVLLLFITLGILQHEGIHIALICATAVAVAVAAIYKYSWEKILEGITSAISQSMEIILLILVLGIMISLWIQGGVIPSMIYYGLKIVSPNFFLIFTFIVCAIISYIIRSFAAAIGILGFLMIILGKLWQIPEYITAGAVVSGAYFGDRIYVLFNNSSLNSPDKTDNQTKKLNFLYYTLPAFLITIFLFGWLGMQYHQNTLFIQNFDIILSMPPLEGGFFIHPVLLIPPILVIVLILFRVPVLFALLNGAFLGGFFSLLFQAKTLKEIVHAAYAGFEAKTKIKALDTLLSKGGLLNTTDAIALLFCSLAFAGVMHKTGMFKSILKSLMKKTKRPGSILSSAVFSSLFLNCFASSQQTARLTTLSLYKTKTEKKGIHPDTLPRLVNDTTMATSPLFLWNASGALVWAILGVKSFALLPYAFLNLLIPVLSVFYAYRGFTLKKPE